MRHINPTRRTRLIRQIVGCTFLCSVAAISMANAAKASDLETTVAQINDRYTTEYKRIEQDGEGLANSHKRPTEVEAMTKVKVEVGTNRVELKLHIPEFVMRTQKIRLHLPQVSMKLKRIVWDNPEVTMKTVKCGQYPEWHGPFKMKWSDIKCDRPVINMVRREAKLDLPQITWADTEFKLDLPETTMKLQTWKFDLPKITVRDVDAEMKKVRNEGEALQTRATELQRKQKEEIAKAVAEDFTVRRGEVVAAFDIAAKQLDDGIEMIKKAGGDPAQIKNDDGETHNLLAERQNLEQQRTTALATLDAEIAKGVNPPA